MICIVTSLCAKIHKALFCNLTAGEERLVGENTIRLKDAFRAKRGRNCSRKNREVGRKNPSRKYVTSNPRAWRIDEINYTVLSVDETYFLTTTGYLPMETTGDSAKFVIDYCFPARPFFPRRCSAGESQLKWKLRKMFAQTKFSLNRQEEIIRRYNNTRGILRTEVDSE